MSQVCFICSKPLTESEIVAVERGLKTWIDSIIERNDGCIEYLKDTQSVRIHAQCRKMYTRKTSIAVAKRQREMKASTSLRVHLVLEPDQASQFFVLRILKQMKRLKRKKALNIRRIICQVATLSFKDNILKVAQNRSDDVSKNVIACIQYEYDLVAAEAKYHNSYYNSFLRPTTGAEIGRLQSNAVTLVMEEIYVYIENNDDCQFSLQEQKDICKTEVPNEKNN
ncbi:hypothetical protein AVEN_92161-1 [Araneus ventricosus]|uniref:Uncharacterized protein n=1 Tax=Araneus ventricosus TaxID=182803 RepID=A0A4Y2GB08_ARAVE|nr:hypothetical protein AVEN_92161-1 [Araneus ventricosus]